MLAGLAGCTGGGTEPAPPPDSSVEAGQTLAARPVPLDVAVGRVRDGRLRPEQRRRLEDRVGAVVEGYFDDAFLGREYPREDAAEAFKGAFATFTGAARTVAQKDADLLTNVRSAPLTEAVAARTKRARLDVLLHRRKVRGVTARVRLAFREERRSGKDVLVSVTGRLLLTSTPSGWRIFGYDIRRSASPAAGR